MSYTPGTVSTVTLDQHVFQNPSAEFRSVPFWSWNDDLDEEVLRAQIRAMHAAGHGGFFMHARVGLRTPYMSSRWFSCVRACIDEAKRLGMFAWLYDEDRWPSGFAGGIVPASSRDYRAKALLCLTTTTPVAVQEALVRVTARLENGRLSDIRPWHPEEPFSEDSRLLIQCYPWVAPMGQGWFGGATYLDTLNPDAVAAFLKSTYERYAAEVGSAFGGVVPGIFTDEPSFWYLHSLPAVHGVGQPPAVPWTDRFPEVFRARHGYDIVPHLPALFYDCDDAEMIRHDYWDTVTHLFYTAYSEQLYHWCDQHGLLLTGHLMAEDSLLAQMLWTGGVMSHYRAFHVPGIDKLGRHTWQVITVKQVDSVACQLGRPRTLCEAFGCSGQDFSLEGRWWVTNWLAVLGINLFNPHLALYSMRGERKRDYPPNLFFQQPWWPYQRPYEDAVARLCYALSLGSRRVDILVIHPLTSAWIAYKPQAYTEVEALDRMLARLTDGLLAMHRDFHFADETILAEFGAVEASQLRVGVQQYRVVILPPVKNLRRSTVELLTRFARAGGMLLAIGRGPQFVDGRFAGRDILPAETIIVPDEVSDGTARQTDVVVYHGTMDTRDAAVPAPPIPDLPALRAALDKVLPARVTITGAHTDRVWYHERVLPDGRELLFLANTRETEDAACVVRWAGAGRLERWDITSGKVESMAATQEDDTTEFTVFLPRMAGALFVRDPQAAPEEPYHVRTQPGHISTQPLSDTWEVRLLSPNVLVLDQCAVRFANGPWLSPRSVLDVAELVQRAGLGVPFTLRFLFTAEEGVAFDTCSLVSEFSDDVVIQLNGVTLTSAGDWWIDPCFRRFPIGRALRTGENLIEITGVTRPNLEIEAVFVIGDFHVPAVQRTQPVVQKAQIFTGWQVAPRLAPTPARQRYRAGSDLVGQGLPHFVGELELLQEFELHQVKPDHRFVLTFSTLHAATALVEVNGVPVGQLLWPPYEVDISEAVQPGVNRIVLRLVTSLRNAFGPLHVAGGEGTWVSPQTFRDRCRWTDECWLVPLGIGHAQLRDISEQEER